MKKQFLALSFVAFFVFACSGDDDNQRLKVLIPVTVLAVDATGTAGQPIEINVRAEAPNGCFGQLEVTLEETSARHYSLQATAIITSSQECPDIIVREDTVIMFTPPAAGKYYFAANQPPITYLRDTLTVQ